VTRPAHERRDVITLRAMSKPKLIYFNAPVSRGEECRLALHVAGIDFEDVRIDGAAWPAMKEQTPYGAMPILELPGHAPVAHSNAILVLIGRRHGLHPKDDFQAALHEGMMQHVEDLRHKVSPTIRLPEAERKAAREALAADYLPAWGRYAEKNIFGDPFFGGGKVDHIPATVFAGFPKLMRVHDAVRDHPAVQAWYAKG